jgi:hypothetical protein
VIIFTVTLMSVYLGGHVEDNGNGGSSVLGNVGSSGFGELGKPGSFSYLQ